MIARELVWQKGSGVADEGLCGGKVCVVRRDPPCGEDAHHDGGSVAVSW
ncbi:MULTISPECIES: hypothetical protein [Bartonella]|uniref:Uncharacterized protein n=1 Tax=Bartonella schoenbuchensis (strain DSM 13525 / NCTC 13165 / R1) TaxID=687861 RepID=E6Z1B4_BARSR|nr:MULTISPECIES: hypothetical protein [Bartonella]CBI82902.1 hypothetical protein BARSC_190175 [Bartonella schoenbuchensis R1]